MKLVLHELGVIKITAAMQTAGGDIRIEYEDINHVVIRETLHNTLEAYLTMLDSGEWKLVLFFDTQGDNMCEDSAVFRIENQRDIYKLIARL